VYYLCGVSRPYKHDNNFHLAFRASANPEAVICSSLYTGAQFKIQGAEAIPFDSFAAYSKYLSKSDKYLTCRNFQFGAQFFNTETPEPEQKALGKNPAFKNYAEAPPA
jgi:hypothetical protein